MRVDELSVCLLELDPQEFHLVRKSFDLDGLEDHDEVNILSEVGLLVVGQVLDAGPVWREGYLRRSSA